MKILYIRHAQSEANAGGRTIDPVSIPITETGYAQSVSLAEEISEQPDLIIVSPYIRTQQTALPLSQKYPKCQMEVWPLHEFTFLSPVICRNTTPKDRRPFVEKYWKSCDPDFIHGEGAESFNQFRKRISEAINDINGLKLNNLIVFTHEQVILLIKLMVLDKQFSMADYREKVMNESIKNTEIFKVESN
ncbi:MAG: histidine phosphatase family protein [Bacteroidetes bacterium]|nr:histidine phosphatase family protein [Bacteroidota bacterium]